MKVTSSALTGAAGDADATADFALLKTLSTTFIERLDALQTIFNNALAAADSRHYKTVCALHLEFHGLWVRLFTVAGSDVALLAVHTDVA